MKDILFLSWLRQFDNQKGAEGTIFSFKSIVDKQALSQDALLESPIMNLQPYKIFSHESIVRKEINDINDDTDEISDVIKFNVLMQTLELIKNVLFEELRNISFVVDERKLKFKELLILPNSILTYFRITQIRSTLPSHDRAFCLDCSFVDSLRTKEFSNNLAPTPALFLNPLILMKLYHLTTICLDEDFIEYFIKKYDHFPFILIGIESNHFHLQFSMTKLKSYSGRICVLPWFHNDPFPEYTAKLKQVFKKGLFNISKLPF